MHQPNTPENRPISPRRRQPAASATVIALTVLGLASRAAAQTTPDSFDEPRPDSSTEPTLYAPEPDPRLRFIESDLLSGFRVHPVSQRTFVGIAAGTSAIPTSAGTLLNAYALTVEPQVRVNFGRSRFARVFDFGVPLVYQLVDTRSAFEGCVPVARNVRAEGGDETAVQNGVKICMASQKDDAFAGAGKLRTEDWDQPSDFAKIIRHVELGREGDPMRLVVSRLGGQSFGNGTVVRRYNPNLARDTARVGAHLDVDTAVAGLESMVNDVANPDVYGVIGRVKPLGASDHPLPLRTLALGVSFVGGRNVPMRIGYEPGLFAPSFDRPVPRLDEDSNVVAQEAASIGIVGIGVDSTLARTRTADLSLYADLQKIAGYGKGGTLGALWRLAVGGSGETPILALRLRAEAQLFDADYLPSFFDTSYDVYKLQYLPAGYQSGGQTFFPTKLGFLAASAGGPSLVGGTVEATASLAGMLTLGAAMRDARPRSGGGAGPAFDDVPNCRDGGGTAALDCEGVAPIVVAQPGYRSLLLHAEVPLRYLQMFASYEISALPTERGVLDLFALNGDNEIFFSGARVPILPVLFLQAEARRNFFVQRVSGLDAALAITQDQRYHAQWTLAVSLAAGAEW